ncbi:MAG: shikimate dehydrogenase, partial [Bosea sp. 32-68-6]
MPDIAIANRTKRVLLGLIGTPIAHSAAPAMHEAAAHAAGFELHYHLIEVEGAGRADLAVILDGVRRMGFSGINVT